MIIGAVCDSLNPLSIGFMLKTIRNPPTPTLHTHTHSRTHTHTHARIQTRTHARTRSCLYKRKDHCLSHVQHGKDNIVASSLAMWVTLRAKREGTLNIYQQADKVYTLPRNPQFSRPTVRCLTCRGTCTTVAPTPVTTAARAKSGQTVWRVSRAAVLRSTLGRCASRPSPPALPTPATTTAPAPRWPVRVSVCCLKELRLCMIFLSGREIN